MAIAGTYAFNPDLGEIMEEAFERAGAEFSNANHIRSARRSLNLITLEWQNKGINLWTIEEQSIPAASIIAGTATYDLDINTIGILDAVIRRDAGVASLQSDITVTEMTSTTYSQLTDKLTEGRPLQYWFHRIGIKGGTTGGADVNPTVTFWPVPELTNEYTFVYWRMRRISDVGTSIGNTVDVPDRFIPALISDLALHMAEKIPSAQGRIPFLRDRFSRDWEDAANEDRNKADLLIHPDMSAY
jgi:hypothetical protein